MFDIWCPRDPQLAAYNIITMIQRGVKIYPCDEQPGRIRFATQGILNTLESSDDEESKEIAFELRKFSTFLKHKY